MKPEIQLISGEMFSFIDPDPDVITIEVIASALSKQCRFAGHVSRPYSVAEHCVRGSYACAEPLAFLLHDASEAFVVDIPTPLKVLLQGYKEIEERVQRVIEIKFGVSIIGNEHVKHTDLVMLATEKEDLKLPSPYPWVMLEGIKSLDRRDSLASFSGNPGTWERRYIDRYRELTQ